MTVWVLTGKTPFMEPDEATAHLEAMRTLTERAGQYRRVQKWVMLFEGILAIAAATIGIQWHLAIMPQFGELWMGTAVVGLIGAWLLLRWPALTGKEPFWSPANRWIASAIFPGLMAGLLVGVILTFLIGNNDELFDLVCIWLFLYGWVLHAAGAHWSPGLRALGWWFVGAGAFLLLLFHSVPASTDHGMHWFMGLFFGGLHLFYGLGLLFTRGPQA